MSIGRRNGILYIFQAGIEYIWYRYEHKKGTRAGTCHYDIIDPMGRSVVGWSEYSPFLLPPFPLCLSLYKTDFVTPSAQPFRVVFLTDISMKLSEMSFLISVLCNCGNSEIPENRVSTKFDLFFQLSIKYSRVVCNYLSACAFETIIERVDFYSGNNHIWTLSYFVKMKLMTLIIGDLDGNW